METHSTALEWKCLRWSDRQSCYDTLAIVAVLSLIHNSIGDGCTQFDERQRLLDLYRGIEWTLIVRKTRRTCPILSPFFLSSHKLRRRKRSDRGDRVRAKSDNLTRYTLWLGSQLMHKENVWLDFIAQGVNIADGTVEFYSDSKEIDIVHVRLISFETVRGINERFCRRTCSTPFFYQNWTSIFITIY